MLLSLKWLANQGTENSVNAGKPVCRSEHCQLVTVCLTEIFFAIRDFRKKCLHTNPDGFDFNIAKCFLRK